MQVYAIGVNPFRLNININILNTFFVKFLRENKLTCPLRRTHLNMPLFHFLANTIYMSQFRRLHISGSMRFFVDFLSENKLTPPLQRTHYKCTF